ncbi:MAG: hypothetical protein OEY44_03255 [Candidatus Peregrinibacteria bacterium]|nr:hypothetical protein [Candidatus Peregrinibacteria bacterium]
MKKYMLASILVLIAILFGMYLLGVHGIKNDIKDEFGLIEGKEKEFTQAIVEYEIFRCNFGLSKSEYVFVSHRDYSFRNEARELWKTTFYSATRPHPLSFSWITKYTGGTDVRNVTFPQLVQMVKEDCSQFQYGYDNPDPDGPRWTYSKYVEEPEADPLPNEDSRRDVFIAEMAVKEFWKMPENQQENIRANYGGPEGKNVKEVLKWFNQVNADIEEGKFSLE